MEQIDVLIVGGGVAGLRAAQALTAVAGCTVMLVEARGPGWNDTVRSTPAQFLVDNGLEDARLQGYHGFVAHSALGAQARFDYGRAAMAALDYPRLCALLLERCRAANFTLCQARALQISPLPPRADAPLVVALSNGVQVTAQLVIDASGAQQWAARQLGITLSPHYSVCYGELLTGVTGKADEVMRLLMPSRSFGNGGGWYYPLPGGRASLGYALLVPAAEREKAVPQVGYQRMRAEFQPYAGWTQHTAVAAVEGGVIPVGRIGRFTDHRVLIAGDAAGQAHPWTVEGVRPAFENGLACARVALRALQARRFERAFLRAYEADWQRINRERFWRAASLVGFTWGPDDERCDQQLQAYQRLTPDQQLARLLENRASFFERVYNAAGYARRRVMRWLR